MAGFSEAAGTTSTGTPSLFPAPIKAIVNADVPPVVGGPHGVPSAVPQVPLAAGGWQDQGVTGGRDDDTDTLRSPVLSPGDTVRLVSPASFPNQEWLATSVTILEGWGLVVEVGDHALDQWGYMAGRDHERLDDLNDAFRAPHVRAVVSTRGGAGAYRIAGGIDVDAVRRDPKPLVGFSDITYLHLALWDRCRLATIHGCLAGGRATEGVRRLLMTTEPLVLEREPDALSARLHRPGRASGPLIGGNLRSVAGCVGAGLPSLEGAVVFLEDERKVGLGQVDRQLTQLLRSGALDGVAGIALGLFTGFDDYTDRGWHLTDVLEDRLGNLGVPVLGGPKLGHGGVGADGSPDQDATTIGPTAVLDATAATLTVGPCVR
jgi:muramoyltetrapeptide carboxypeptidase